MSQTKVQFIECEDGDHAIVVVHTTVRGGLIGQLVDALSRIRIEVHKFESRFEDDRWIQRLVVAAPRGRSLDREALDELRGAVLCTVEEVGLEATGADAESGTFEVVPTTDPGVGQTG